MTIIGYIRVSTEDQANGPLAQLDTLQSYCKQKSLVLSHVYSDIGVSGATDVTDRPGLSSAIASLQTGDTLLAARRDRYARDVVIIALLGRQVTRMGCILATADGSDDSPEGRMMCGMLDLFSEYERSQIRSRTKAALGARKARGEVYGVPPYGYRAEAGRLVPDASERHLVALARVLVTTGGIASTVIALTRAGYVGRTGRAFSYQQVKRMTNRTMREP